MISITDLSLSTENKKIIENFNIEINKNEIIGICGESGAGKSILAYFIAGLSFENIKILGTIKRNFKNFKILFQNPYSQIFSKTVYDEIKLSLFFNNKSNSNDDILNTAKFYEIENILHKKINELSFGEVQKTAIVSILISNPELIILDEISQYIDMNYLNTIMNLIKSHNEDISIIIIEHNYEILNNLCSRIISLNGGKYEILNKISVKPLDKINITGIQNDFIVRLENVSFGYIKNKNIFNNFNLDINYNSFLTITGLNGSGKTTLTKIIINLLKFKGNLYFKNLKNPKFKNIRKYIGYVFQNPDFQIFCNSVKEEIIYTSKILNLPIDDNYFSELIELFHVEHLLNKSPFVLSYGEKRKINIISAILHKPELVIYDGPSVGLDYEQKNNLLKLFELLNKQNITQILISHDEQLLKSINIVNNTETRQCLVSTGRYTVDL